MSRRTLALTALSTLTLVALALWLGLTPDAEARAVDKAPEQIRRERVARGEYLVSTSGCHDCHTPFTEGPRGAVPDMTRALSGHPADFEVPPPPAPSGPWIVSVLATNTAWSGPWGVSFTANLTPDRETGTGKWTEDNFVQTIRNGRHLGSGREILPPMPIPVYSKLTDEDLKSIYAYLQSIPAIHNRVPAPLPPRGT